MTVGMSYRIEGFFCMESCMPQFMDKWIKQLNCVNQPKIKVRKFTREIFYIWDFTVSVKQFSCLYFSCPRCELLSVVFLSTHFKKKRQNVIHSSATRLFHDSLVYGALRLAGSFVKLTPSRCRLSARFHIIAISLELIFFLFFLFRAYFNEPRLSLF